MLTVISGTNLYAAQARLQELLKNSRETAVQVDMSELDALDKLKANVQGGSLFSEEDVIVVRYLENEKALHNQVVKLAASVPETTRLIIYLPGTRKNSALLKQLNELADETYFQDTLDEYKLSQWVETTTKQRGGKITGAVAKQLVEWVGDNQMVLSNELDKLIAYDKKITSDTIREVAIKVPTTTIFNMLDVMLKGDLESALKYYRELIEQRLDANYIISMICWQAHALSMAVISKGLDTNEFAARAGVSPFVLKKALSAARRLNIRDTLILNAQILRVDEQLKTAPVDGERLVEQLVRRVATSSQAS